MLRLKADSSKLSQNGSVPNDLFADISTRSLNSVTVGESCGKISTGKANVFVGYESGEFNNDGSFCVFVGFEAGQFNKTANWNTFVGSYCGRNNTRGNKNTFVGFRAGELTLDGSESTAIGVNAMRENAVGNRNVAVGMSAGERLLEGDNNTMIGSEAGQNIRSGNLNTMAGFRSGRGSFKGNENTYFGAYSGYSNELGDGNAFIGYKSGEYLTEGSYNVAVGAYTLQYSRQGSCNIALGAFSGSLLQGSGNVLVGTGANANTVTGNFNTTLGTNTGFNANGGNNVYIGYETATYTQGDCNVVIGSSAFTSNASSNSVVIGYNAADTVFRSGTHNIFIGVGADAHTSTTSYAIAIGSRSTRSSDNAISIGENIDNDGLYSVLLGYDLYSDSHQCVAIGYKTQINNVIVFNDPLNYIFPVSDITQYAIFNLKEHYTDMMYLGVSNTISVATIYASNAYDSGCNLLKGVTRTDTLNLLDYIGSNVVYHNITIVPAMNNKNIVPPYISHTCNLPSYDFDIITSMTHNTLRIPIGTTYEASNLIPTDNLSYIDYQYTIGRRIAIQKLDFNNNYTTSENKLTTERIFITDIINVPINIEPIETLNFFETTQNGYRVIEHPIYGDIHFENDKLYYEPYKEGFFACNDTFRVAYATQLDNTFIVPEGIQTSTISFSDSTLPQQSNLNFHMSADTIFNESFDSNLLDSNLQFIPPNILRIRDPTSNVITPLVLRDHRTVQCSYNRDLQNAISYRNVSLSMNSYSLESTQIPFVIDKIVQHPLYGRIIDGVYEPFAFNFSKDTFIILSSDTEITIDLLTNNGSFETSNLNMFLSPTRVTYNSNTYTLYSSNIEIVPLYTRFNRSVKVNETTIDTFNMLLDTTLYTVKDPNNPFALGYYLHTCNIEIIETQQPITYDDAVDFEVGIPTPNNLPPFYDYYIYDRNIINFNQNPYIATLEYKWDYNSANGFGDINFAKLTPDNTHIPPVFSNENNVGSNQYILLLSKTIVTSELYKEVSNVVIYDSNQYYQNDIYRDEFGNFIYNNRYALEKDRLSTSNYTIITPTIPFTETISYFGYSNDKYITSNISVLELRDSTFYGYDMSYTVSQENKLTVLQKNKGIVSTFHQSNISMHDIVLWDEFGAKSNLYLTDRTIPINYYSNLENSTAPVIPIDFIKGIYHLSNEIILRTDNIDFIDRSNVCVSDGQVFIHYIDQTNKLITQFIPSFYSNINPIDLNIGLLKKRRTLQKRDLRAYSNGETIEYNVSTNDVKFYKSNVATLRFTQQDVNDGSITFETSTSGVVDIGALYTLELNTYLQNYYLNSTSEASLILTFDGKIFEGEFWNDLAERKDDARIHILNNPIKGILYSSNTHSIVNDITYSEFLNQKIHYIPFQPNSIEIDTIDLFLSYSNVISPVYSLQIRNNIVHNRPSFGTIVERINITNDVISLNVDESNYTYLTKLLLIERNDIIYYVVNPPQNGILLNTNFISVGTFTSEDIREKRVFYQNYKGTVDTFEVRLATTLYDLSLNTMHVEINISPMPQLLRNNYGYIYSSTNEEGRLKYQRLSTNNLEISNGGVYVFEKTYMDIYVKKDGVYEPRTSFLKNEEVYYRPSEDFFEFGSNENREMNMKFFTYSASDIEEPNKLASINAYRNIYNQEWTAKYNTYDSSNTILAPINANQSITYTKEVDNEIFDKKKCTIGFDYKPLQSILSGDENNDFLRTYLFTFEMLTFNNINILSITFTESSIVVTIGTQQYDITPTNPIFDWNTFYMTNYDDTNDDKLSFYINDVNYLEESVESLDLSSLKTIRITVPIEDPKNLYNKTLTRTIHTSGSTANTNLYYNLVNYNTKLYFRNFEILLRIIESLDENARYSTAYNIAIGDYLQVNGFNNICIGKNFLTTGIGSIIIGNDIGSTPNNSSMLAGSFNEIFSSIIISTSSFIDTKVRDVIAIGNNIMNNAGGTDNIDLFFSKKPVLIGNNITTDTLDFHVNIQNTFLKTDIGYEQIYCGLQNEAVCIGYSSNEEFNNATNRLYVNGNVMVSGTILEKTPQKTFRRHVFPSMKIESGTNHSYTKTIEWENPITDVHDTIRLKCAFRYIGGLQQYGYYNFESVISVAEIYNITHSKSADVLINHSVEMINGAVSNSFTGAKLTLNFITDIISSYLVVDFEIESETLNLYGNLNFA